MSGRWIDKLFRSYLTVREIWYVAFRMFHLDKAQDHLDETTDAPLGQINQKR